MKTREFDPIRWCFVLGLVLFVTLAAFPGGKPLSLQERPGVEGTVDCREIGRLNGEVGYQYDVTLTNNTASKLIVKYKVIFKAGDVPQKTHSHSTVMIANENMTETHDDKMSETEWDKVTVFRLELEWEPAK